MKIHELIESKSWKTVISKLEIISSLLLLVGLVLFYLNNSPNVLLIIGFSALAIVYFFDGFKELLPSNLISSSFFRIHGWGLTISCVSMLFTLMNWRIDRHSLIISMIILFVSLLLGLKFRNEENKGFIDKFYFIRLVIALFLLCFVYFSKVHVLV
jgi:hypothetical protein